jgi:hypothetical protein
MNPRTTTGLDVAKESVTVCRPADGKSPRDWPVEEINLTGDWRPHLLYNLNPDDITALEPTGWHYSRPVVVALEQRGVVVLHRIGPQAVIIIRYILAAHPV